MKIEFVYKTDSGQYISTFVPLTFCEEYKDIKVHFPELELDSYSEDDLEASLVDGLEQALTVLPEFRVNVIGMCEGKATFKISITPTTVDSICTDKVVEEDVEKFKELVKELIGYIVELKMKTHFAKKKHTIEDPIGELKEILSGGARPRDDADEDDIIEYINNKTKATVCKPKEKLDDYLCSDVLKDELNEIKEFFENEKTYVEYNIDIPKGILFKGPPGTGKTYAARCIAGSTDCYFLQCTASSLQGQYIGSGAQNIRDIFNAAKMLREKSGKGVLIFIDEIDSFGSRTSHGGGAGGEEDRTVNQLLAEMSGFEDVVGVMVLAATNYPERLDDALLRSGRFSRQINISYPEEAEREALVEYYFSKLKMPLDDVDVSEITSITEYLTPADIKNIANESAILSVRQKLSKIPLDNINEAINKTITKNIRSKDGKLDIKLVSAHEAGHVLAEVLLCDTYPVKVTSYSYGDAGGFTQSSFKLIGIQEKECYINEVKVLLAGRAAEFVMCHKETNGASNDLEKAKKILRGYYEYYNFQPYTVKDLDQLVIDDLNKYYFEVIELFQNPENLEKLKNLTEELYKNRVLYTSDLKSLLMKKGGIIL